jgi:SAM-dependent methyltransferase
MDSQMSELVEEALLVQAMSIIQATCSAYRDGSEEYADATESYATYPGLKDDVLEFARVAPVGLPMLDLGCGGGRDSRLLASLGRAVIAGDICVTMLDSARRRSAVYGAGTIRYTCLNALELPFPADRFGGIWASGCLLHLPSPVIPQALSEVLRALAPGGVAAISMRAGAAEGWRDGGTLAGRRWFTFVTPDQFAEEMRRLGFGDVQIRFTGRQDWFIALGRKLP